MAAKGRIASEGQEGERNDEASSWWKERVELESEGGGENESSN